MSMKLTTLGKEKENKPNQQKGDFFWDHRCI